MTDLTERLQAAAAAIADVAPGVEVGNHGQMVAATAWIENKVNIGKLLGRG